MSRPPEGTSGRASGITGYYYNFIRPHRALKFGREIPTPDIQAGLTRERLTFRKIFCSGIVFLDSCEIDLVFVYSATAVLC
jgi:hypothetical protein